MEAKIGKRKIHEWIDYYEKYVKYCEKKRRRF